MNVRDIPRTAVDRYLRLVRFPLNTAVGLLPGDGSGARPAAEIALDRADASLRELLATALRVPGLREDSLRLRAAAAERERALRLRGEAQRRREQAGARVERRERQASRRRQHVRQREQRKHQEHQPRERLETLEAETDALREREHEITARQEAQRLADSAARAKEERKQE